jgi:hypothetical protein
MEDAYFRDELPERFVPMAVTGGEDDTLLIDLSNGGSGRLLAWVTGRPPGFIALPRTFCSTWRTISTPS